MVDERRLAAELLNGVEDLDGQLGPVCCERAPREECDLAIGLRLVRGGQDVARLVGIADAVDGAICGERIPFLVDLHADPRIGFDQPEVLEVGTSVLDQVEHIVMSEAGVLARSAEEASADRLDEPLVGCDGVVQLFLRG